LHLQSDWAYPDQKSPGCGVKTPQPSKEAAVPERNTAKTQLFRFRNGWTYCIIAAVGCHEREMPIMGIFMWCFYVLLRIDLGFNCRFP
jgi:hypothetical protein